MTAIIGPSGCGKSTLLRTINRIYEFYPDQHATARSSRRPEYPGPPLPLSDLRRQVGMVFQKPTPFPSSIRNNVAFALSYYERLSKPRSTTAIEDALRQAALWDEVKDKLDASALVLSGGQQQRLCIARTIAVRPEIVLLDEPTSALDPISTAKIEELIHELRERFTIVIVTHNMQQAARVSQNTAFFHLGELIEFGDTARSSPIPASSGPRITSPAATAEETDDAASPGHTLKAFDEELDQLRALVSRDGRPCRACDREAMRCLMQRDCDGAAARSRTTRRSTRSRPRPSAGRSQLIALRAPMADDLREAVAALKIFGVVERIGDYAKNIAKRVRAIEIGARSSRSRCFRKWRGWSPEMVHDVLDAFVRRDAERRSGVPSATSRSTISTIRSSAHCSPS